jgi:hypothetical protein
MSWKESWKERRWLNLKLKPGISLQDWEKPKRLSVKKAGLGSRFETKTSRIRSRRTAHSTAAFGFNEWLQNDYKFRHYVLIPAVGRYVSSHRHVQTDPGAHQHSYPKCTGGSFSEVKGLGLEDDHSFHPVPRLRFRRDTSEFPPYVFTTKILNSVTVVRKRTIPTERPPLVGGVSANLCG